MACTAYPVDFLTNWNQCQTNVQFIIDSCSAEASFSCRGCAIQIASKAVMQICNKRLYDRAVNATISDVFVLNCPGCKKTVAVWVGERWWSVDELLKTSDGQKEGFVQVITPGERLVLWCLNSVVFQQYENEDKRFTFLEIPPSEYAKVYWKNGEAVAFYTLKKKGSCYDETQLDCYTMSVVDLIFVRQTARRQGIGQKVVEDVIHLLPSQDIGFSRPVSEPMLKVLHKFLTSLPDCRTLLWETEWVGCEGYRKNIWFIITRMLVKQAKQQTLSKTAPSPVVGCNLLNTR